MIDINRRSIDVNRRKRSVGWHEAAKQRLGQTVANLEKTAKVDALPREVVVAQLVERSLSIQEVRSSNPVIGKNLFIH